jgi:hypothetical protein
MNGEKPSSLLLWLIEILRTMKSRISSVNDYLITNARDVRTESVRFLEML